MEFQGSQPQKKVSTVWFLLESLDNIISAIYLYYGF